MKERMKRIYIWMVLAAVASPLAFAGGGEVGGSNEHYRVLLSNQVRYDVMVKTIGQADGTSFRYAMMLKTQNNHPLGVAFFRIETLPKGREAWLLVQQTKDRLISVQPNFLITYNATYESDGNKLRLLADSQGENMEINKDLKLTLVNEDRWGDITGAFKAYKPFKKPSAIAELDVEMGTIKGDVPIRSADSSNVSLRDQAHLEKTDLIPGAALIRKEIPSLFVGSGAAYSREIEAVVVRFEEPDEDHDNMISYLLIVRMDPGGIRPLYPVTFMTIGSTPMKKR